MSVLQEFKAMMQPGTVITVENHYLIRAGATHHACYGTTTRTVTRVNSASWFYEGSRWPNKWPKAAHIQHAIDQHGEAFEILGHPSEPNRVFLTIRKVSS